MKIMRSGAKPRPTPPMDMRSTASYSALWVVQGLQPVKNENNKYYHVDVDVDVDTDDKHTPISYEAQTHAPKSSLQL